MLSMPESIGVGTAQNVSSQTLAAAYVRMSTEHQQYSTENQLDAIRLYAITHDLDIIKVYTDSGRNGLRPEDRDALIQLFLDVESGYANFSTCRRDHLNTASIQAYQPSETLLGYAPTKSGIVAFTKHWPGR
jgi:predicted site-specific integrase-resolvase